MENLNATLARHRFLIPGWILMFLGGAILPYRYRKITTITKFLNTMSLILMVAVTAQIMVYVVQARLAQDNVPETPVMRQQSSLITPANRDVYYILVDAFGRQDLLAEHYQVDISSFASKLTQIGFYIPECTQGNYDHTLPSLTSSLNMQYLDTLGLEYHDDRELFLPLVHHSLVREQFESLGYSTVTFKSLYPGLDIQDSTYYFDYFKDESGLASLSSLNFQYLFLRTTAIRPAIDLLESKPDMKISPSLAAWIPVNNTLSSRDYRQYQQNVFALDTLETLPDLHDKIFVYAHLYVTHQPFVFHPDGRFHPSLRQDDEGYRDQVIFATGRLLQIVRTILEKSETPPIIIIQGDHSHSEMADRLKIMNAYYFPEGGESNLYPAITPVNTFRVLFNTYFGGSFEILPDISRYRDADKNLHEAPATCVNGTSP